MGRLKAATSALTTARGRLSRPAFNAATRTQERDTRTAWRAWYKTARWQKLRQVILKRDNWRCAQSGVLVIGKYPAGNSAVIDHKIPHRGDAALFWDPANLQVVSKEYHDGEKQRLEKSGRLG